MATVAPELQRDDPEAYIARDRRRALADRQVMPDRVEGAALFADISGFSAYSLAWTSLWGSLAFGAGRPETRSLLLLLATLVPVRLGMHLWRLRDVLVDLFVQSFDMPPHHLTLDLDAFDVVLDEADVQALAPRPRLGVTAQTTQPIEKVRGLVACIQQRFAGADVRFIDTVCRPTKQRQTAAVDLARQSDIVIVVGGASSNNTRQLVETCARYCDRVHHVQTDADLCAGWFRGADTVGLTAGTSTPDDVVDRVESRIRALVARDGDGVTAGMGASL